MKADDSPGRLSRCARFSSLGLILLFLLLSFPVDQLQAQTFFYIQQKRKQITIPFTLHRNLIIIPVQLNGKGPYNFLLDTGVGTALVTNPTLLDSLGVTP